MTDKIIVIVGPTAVGKSSLGIKLAKKFKGEIISADSRQVYKGMDIGTGKVTKAEQRTVPHHLLDVADPKRQFTVSHFVKLANSALKKISKNNKVPFIVGGTAFYVYSLIDDLKLPEVKPDSKLRKSLEKKSTDELFKMLKKLDPKRAKTIDVKNRPRLIRALEINIITGRPVPDKNTIQSTNDKVLFLGINKEPGLLRKLISKRVEQRIKNGLVNEVKKLKLNRISSQKLQKIGLTYSITEDYLKGLISKLELPERITTAEYQFAKRQMTWFKKDNRIQWIKDYKDAESRVKKFLTNS